MGPCSCALQNSLNTQLARFLFKRSLVGAFRQMSIERMVRYIVEFE